MFPAHVKHAPHSVPTWKAGSGSRPSMVSFWNGAPSSPFPYPPEHSFLATVAYCRARVEPFSFADSRCMKYDVFGERLQRTCPRAGAAAPLQVTVSDDASLIEDHTCTGDAYGSSSGRTRAVGATPVQSRCTEHLERGSPQCTPIRPIESLPTRQALLCHQHPGSRLLRGSSLLR